jgi:hypothetical protein
VGRVARVGVAVRRLDVIVLLWAAVLFGYLLHALAPVPVLVARIQEAL